MFQVLSYTSIVEPFIHCGDPPSKCRISYQMHDVWVLTLSPNTKNSSHVLKWVCDDFKLGNTVIYIAYLVWVVLVFLCGRLEDSHQFKCYLGATIKLPSVNVTRSATIHWVLA
jgi:hypothetical protein